MNQAISVDIIKQFNNFIVATSNAHQVSTADVRAFVESIIEDPQPGDAGIEWAFFRDDCACSSTALSNAPVLSHCA